MKITKAEFVTSHGNVITYTEAALSLPEFCVAGRSNAGKSTFINMLTGRSLAKTSSAPGRTRLINIFDINDSEFLLVDLPGYGYAEAGKTRQNEWQALAGGYLQSSKNLKQVFVLADCRVESALDKQLIKYLYYYRIPFTILASKADKLKKSEIPAKMIKMAAFFGVGVDDIIPISHSGLGKEKVLLKIETILENSVVVEQE